MTEQRIEKPELIDRVGRRVNKGTGTVEEILDAALEEIYQALKRGESVSLRNFGTFYVRQERESWVFRLTLHKNGGRCLVGRPRTGVNYERHEQ